VLDRGGWLMPCPSHLTPEKDTQYLLWYWTLGRP